MRYDTKGILVTILFHVALLLIMIFMGFRTPLPLPAEQGIMVNFGSLETGKGKSEPMQQVSPQKSTPVAQPEIQKTVVTQDFQDAPVLPTKKVVKQKQQVSTEKPKDLQVKKVEVKEERKVNPLTLYKGKGSSESSGEGITGGGGNQGAEDGDVSGSHFIGSAGDMGISVSLEGRQKIALPTPSYDYQKEGVVVVQITVDRNGRVTDALPGVKGSTTLDDYLLEAAKKAALGSSFTKKLDGSMYQKGTITYRFKLK